VVSAFYYPWFTTTIQDGSYAHWAQGGHDPPNDIASVYYPTLGAYSSDSTNVLNEQMGEIARAGIDEIAVSWWGWGSPEDQRLPDVIAAANRRQITVAVHIEPYEGRTVASVVDDIAHLRTLNVNTFYVYQPFDQPATDWAPANDALHQEGVATFAETALPRQAAAGHFSGIYTYDILTYGAGKLARLCNEAHAVHLLCAPSVGPGYDGVRAGEAPVLSARRDGATYDNLWTAALAAKPQPSLKSIVTHPPLVDVSAPAAIQNTAV